MHNGSDKETSDLINKKWDEIQQRHKWICRKTLFYIGELDYGMAWGIIINGKTIYHHETNWRERLKNEKRNN